MRDLQDATAELNRIFASLMPQPPQTKYWVNKATGIEYHYTTEPTYGTGNKGRGYYAIIYKPIGKGARSKRPSHYRMIDERGPYDRTTARRLAYQMYLESKQKNRLDQFASQHEKKERTT